MTTRTRRRLFVALLVVALTLPAESILLTAISSSSATQDAEVWAGSLSDPDLIEAGDKVRGHSYAFRRAILRRASPEQRVRFWSRHVQDYIDGHPELGAEQRDVLATVLSVLTPDALSSPSAEKSESMRVVAEQLVAVLGRDEAGYLLVWLGPRQTSFFASLDPIRLRLAGFVRTNFTMAAQSEPACDCTPDWGCDGWGLTCSETATCSTDQEWPMCGWFWNEPCRDLCVNAYGD